MQNSSILACIDFSEKTVEFLKKLFNYCTKNGIKLFVLHAIESSIFFKQKNIEEIRKNLLARLKAEFDFLEDKSFFCIEGELYQVVERLVRELDISIVALSSSDSNSFFEELLFGSHTKSVVRYSKIPVLVVKNSMPFDFSNILIPTDLTEYSKKAIQKVAKLFPNSKLRLFHFFSVPFEGRLGMYGIDLNGSFEYINQMSKEVEINAKNFLKTLELPEDRVSISIKRGSANPESFFEENKYGNYGLVALHTTGTISFFAFELLNISKHDVLILRAD